MTARDRLNARETLHVWLTDNLPITGGKANMLLDAYAHELAEKLRAEPECCRDDCVGTAADLIDPEVNK